MPHSKILAIIVRHGRTPWNALDKIQGQTNDISLDEEGKVQMKKLGGILHGFGLSFVACVSPLSRAQESFQILNAFLHIPQEDVFTISALREMNFGDCEGRLKSEVYTPEFKKHRAADRLNIPYPNGESYADVARRLQASSLKDCLNIAQKTGKVLLLVGHESVNRMIPSVLGLSDDSLLQATESRQKNNEIVVVYDDKTSELQSF